MKKIAIIIISILLVTGCSILKKENIENSVVNNNSNIIKEQTVYNLDLNNVSLIYFKGTSTFNVKVTNNTDSDINISKFTVIFKAKSGSIITTVSGNIGDKIPAKNSIETSLTSDVDLSDAYSVEYDIG